MLPAPGCLWVRVSSATKTQLQNDATDLQWRSTEKEICKTACCIMHFFFYFFMNFEKWFGCISSFRALIKLETLTYSRRLEMVKPERKNKQENVPASRWSRTVHNNKPAPDETIRDQPSQKCMKTLLARGSLPCFLVWSLSFLPFLSNWVQFRHYFLSLGTLRHSLKNSDSPSKDELEQEHAANTASDEDSFTPWWRVFPNQ